MTIRPFTGDPLSACCGTPDACSQAHLYCFNRTPKEANVEAMHKFEDGMSRKEFEAVFDKTQRAAQAAINEATHGSTVDLPEATAALKDYVAKTEAKFEVFIEAKDEIKRPDHYARFAIEPCTFIMLNELPYWTGNVVKYVVRAPHKHGDERIDIRKAIRYCEMRIEELDRVAAGTDGAVVGNPL